METGDVHRKPKEPIIEYPAGYQEMVEKLREREQEQVDLLKNKHGVTSEPELAALAEKAMKTRMGRLASEHTALKDHTIKREAESEEIKEKKDLMRKEIADMTKTFFEKAPEAAKSSLKGRKITLGGVLPPGTSAA